MVSFSQSLVQTLMSLVLTHPTGNWKGFKNFIKEIVPKKRICTSLMVKWSRTNLCIKSQLQHDTWGITKNQIFMQHATNTLGDK